MPRDSTLDRIFETLRRATFRKPTPEEELEKLRERLQSGLEIILYCPHCKGLIKWKEPNGDIKELFPLLPPGKGNRTFPMKKEFCPRCGKILADGWRVKQGVYDEGGGNRDKEVLY